MGRDHRALRSDQGRDDFNPRAPCGARRQRCLTSQRRTNFNPRAPCGARHVLMLFDNGNEIFQSTRPVWGATLAASELPPSIVVFQSTRPVWGATKVDAFAISGIDISIHAPRVGRDGSVEPVVRRKVRFQSTRPVWGATVPGNAVQLCSLISIHAPRVGRDVVSWSTASIAVISIHAPRVGRDRGGLLRRSPRRPISIHAPRVGRDNSKFPVGAKPKHFNPRAPCGARLHDPVELARDLLISIHAPRVGRDLDDIAPTAILDISIHAPRVGRDSSFSRRPCTAAAKFQSTRPVWGATINYLDINGVDKIFQSTRPVWGATLAASELPPSIVVFQSTRPVWGATITVGGKTVNFAFQSTRPVWGATQLR